jgi:DNA polymerase III subunit alpha
MNWAPLCNYTHYSLLKGFSKPDKLVAKCSKNKYKACGIADYKSVSGAVAFVKSCKKHGIKPIIGCSFDGFTLFSKNIDGWFNLIKLISSLDEDGQLNPKFLRAICSSGNLVAVASDKSLSPISGEDFYKKSEWLMDTYYTEKEEAELHRVLLCSKMKTTLPKVRSALKKGENIESKEFFDRNDFHVLDRVEVCELLGEEGDTASSEIINKCEDYDILRRPELPAFETPTGESEEDYLKQLCREGWREILLHQGKIEDEDMKTKYLERFKKEFDVINEANLFGYFLIVRDIINYVNDQGWLSGPGRGSAAGCLISYLVGITKIDPIEFDLLFERFYNSGRNTEDHVSLPDIDIDVPGKKRDEIIAYLKDRYGKSSVSQMLTFGRLQGRSAIKEVLRMNEACSFGEMNEISKAIPNEADVSDQLQAMEEQDRSIIRYALINNSEDLRDYCFINSQGGLEGDYAKYFQQAIDIEGTFKTQGKHAAGVVISSSNLSESCPMVPQKSGGEKIVGIEMTDLESLGHVKFDVLGINLLDKIMKIKELLDV